MPHLSNLQLGAMPETLWQSYPPTWPDAHFDDVSSREDELLHHLSCYHVTSLEGSGYQGWHTFLDTVNSFIEKMQICYFDDC